MLLKIYVIVVVYFLLQSKHPWQIENKKVIWQMNVRREMNVVKEIHT